jgi:hypothetical protein
MGTTGVVSSELGDDAQRRVPIARGLYRVISALVLACALAGCAYQGSGPVEVHYP